MHLLPLILLGLSARADDPSWRPIYPDAVSATSFLFNQNGKYSGANSPLLAFDGDPKSAWVEGAPGPGDGGHLDARLAVIPAARAVRVGIQNGCQRSDKTLPTLPAPKDVKLVLNMGGKEVVSGDLSLERKVGWQELVLPLEDDTPIDGFSLVVVSSWPGEGSEDACLGEIRLEVDADLYSAEAEDTRKTALAASVASRAAAVKFLSKPAKDYPFPQGFVGAPATFDDAAFEAAISPDRQMVASARKSTDWNQVTMKGKPFPTAPDGLSYSDSELLAFALDSLRPDLLSFTETTEELASVTGAQRSETGWELWRSNTRVQRAEDGSLSRVAFDVRRAVTEHDKYETHRWILVDYAGGHPSQIYSAAEVYQPGMAPFFKEERVLVLDWTDGRVSAMHALSQRSVEDAVFGANVITEAIDYAPR